MPNLGPRLMLGASVMALVTGCGLVLTKISSATAESTKAFASHSAASKKPHTTPTPTPVPAYELTSFPILGVGSYHLDLLSGYSMGNNPQAQLIDLPQGAVWITPAGFLGPQQQTLQNASVWLTPWRPGGGNLWRDARDLKTIRKSITSFSALGYTGPYAIFEETVHTTTIPLIVNAQNLTTTTLTTPITGIAIVEDSFLAYQSGTRVVAVNLSTGQQSEKPIPTHRTAANWAVVSHGIQIGSTLVRLPEIPAMPVRTTPVGYRWLGLSSNNPLMVIPSNWPVVKSPPVGSWTRYVAHNPAMPKEVVTVELSACQGCASPAPLGGPVYAPDAPVLGAASKTFSWVTDHFVTQKVLKAGWLTMTDTVVWPFGSGNLVVSWTVPVNQKTPFAQSLLVGWRLSANQIGPVP